MCQRTVIHKPVVDGDACSKVPETRHLVVGRGRTGQDTLYRGVSLHEERTSELRPGWIEGISHIQVWDRGIPGRGEGLCQGPG